MTCELIDGSVFLHVPKTGGTWVYNVLREAGLVRRPVGRHPHAGYERAVLFPRGKRRWKEWSRGENWRPENWFSPGRRMTLPRSFCFVRHPVRWYESWWRYLMGLGEVKWLENVANGDRLVKRLGPLSVPSAAFDQDFNTFVRKLHERFPGYVTWLYGLYAVPEVDFVGRQEHLREDLAAALRTLGLAFDEAGLERGRRNEAKHDRANLRWDAGLLRDVQAAEQTVMCRYNYETLSAEAAASH